MANKMLSAVVLVVLVLTAPHAVLAQPVDPTSLDQAIPAEALTAQEKGYSVLVLGQEAETAIASVQGLLSSRFGKEVITWSVPEEDRINVVFAFPSPTDADEVYRLDMDIEATLQSEGYDRNIRLYDWQVQAGPYFEVWGTEGGKFEVSYFAHYGWDNRISRYREYFEASRATLYDCSYLQCTYCNVTSTGNIPRYMDNRASSAMFWF